MTTCDKQQKSNYEIKGEKCEQFWLIVNIFVLYSTVTQDNSYNEYLLHVTDNVRLIFLIFGRLNPCL